MKGTRVDGVYTADPEKDPKAVKYDELTFDKAMENHLKVMDQTAFALCREGDMPIIVFDMNQKEISSNSSTARKSELLSMCNLSPKLKTLTNTTMIEKANEILEEAKMNMEDAVVFLEEDLKTYRVGKANPTIFSNVLVDYYGSMTPVPQVASVTAPDAKTLAIQPWEKKMIPLIEKAIIDANLGLTPSNNGETIRCTVPPLTEERRKELIKKAKAAGESAKIVVRNARRDAIEALKKAQKEGLAEDMQKDYEDKVQKATDSWVKRVDELVAAKEKDILTV